MKIKFKDYLFKKLATLGIKKVFGLPGDYNFELVEAILANPSLDWVGCTNELNAGYSADGYARINGYGALLTTFGVGELSAINAVAGSMAENVPVIKIAGVPSAYHIKRNSRIHHNLADVDYKAFFRAFSNVVEGCAFLDEKNAKQETDRLINLMIKTKKPVYIAVPMDIEEMEVDDVFEPYILQDASKSADEAADEIIKTIESSKNPIIIADILTRRFGAKQALNRLLDKTKIPSLSFIRGMDIIKNSTENYLGVYADTLDNDTAFKYLQKSDCIILSGAVLSDLNSFSFEDKFRAKIELMPNCVTANGKRFENAALKDVLEKIERKIIYKSKKNLERTFKYQQTQEKKEKALNCDIIYSKIGKFLQNGDIFITEVGLAPHGAMKIEFPDDIRVENQSMWGSIGWATPCAQGCSFALEEESKRARVVMISGDGAHQLTAQEISTIMRHGLKPVIFIVNNHGYTVERILCDNPDFEYNDIAVWNYYKFPEAFEGQCFRAKVKDEAELDKILEKIKNEDKMCYIELITDKLDVPSFSRKVAKHPEIFNKLP